MQDPATDRLCVIFGQFNGHTKSFSSAVRQRFILCLVQRRLYGRCLAQPERSRQTVFPYVMKPPSSWPVGHPGGPNVLEPPKIGNRKDPRLTPGAPAKPSRLPPSSVLRTCLGILGHFERRHTCLNGIGTNIPVPPKHNNKKTKSSKRIFFF